MAKQVLNNAETHGSIRDKINDNFTEVYTDIETHKAENVAYMIYVARDLSLNGEQIINLPFKAKSLNINSFISDSEHVSWGLASSTSNQIAICLNPTQNIYYNSADVVFFYDSTNSVHGKLKTINDDSIVIEWTNTITGTAHINILAQTH